LKRIVINAFERNGIELGEWQLDEIDDEIYYFYHGHYQ